VISWDKPPAGFQKDLAALPNDDVRRMTMLTASSVKKGERRGVKLDKRVATADLSDCYKIYFDPQGDIKPRYRLAYRLRSAGLQVVAAQLVAVGERDGLDAYLCAAKNLGR
jgi:hypothetical protein